ncbi:MAG: glycine--tRNA ligase [Gemmatales bacterium]|nr:glycine--tRNA ligase [Gemmatales bacterium]MDW8385771.1 glycine--tRNA ligase [Gemmatales bacterium]
MDMDKLVSLCKRRGFIFPSSEIYGGLNGFWDYGPLGVELKNNIKQAWWQDMVRNPPPGPDGEEVVILGVDCAIIMNPRVWEASGHVSGFADPMVDCKKCRKRFRADKVWLAAYVDAEGVSEADLLAVVEQLRTSATAAGTVSQAVASPKLVVPLEADGRDEAERHTLSKTQQKAFKHKPIRLLFPLPQAPASWPRKCPACGEGDLTEPRSFNLMFKTFVGALEDASSVAYLRPETAQGIFVNFKNVLDSSRVKLPFGIAQIGKAFRNEINPRNFTFRSREFEQMEIEFFCHPGESMKWYRYWRDVRKEWYTRLGIRSERLRPREQGKDELAHYSIGTTDIEYLFPFSNEPQELEGVAHRGCFDLSQHQQFSGKDLSYFDEAAWERDKAALGFTSFKEWVKSNPPKEQVEKYQFIPHVIEPSAGADRFTLAVLCEAYDEDEIGGEKRVVMRFHPRLAPIKAAVLPLVNKDGMPERALALYRELKREFPVFYDDSGAIGRRYRRQDEIGTPYCFTIDGQTAEDGTITLRNRDDCVQIRIPIAAAADELRKRIRD